jgi:hypothetical protein
MSNGISPCGQSYGALGSKRITRSTWRLLGALYNEERITESSDSIDVRFSSHGPDRIPTWLCFTERDHKKGSGYKEDMHL